MESFAFEAVIVMVIFANCILKVKTTSRVVVGDIPQEVMLHLLEGQLQTLASFAVRSRTRQKTIMAMNQLGAFIARFC